MNSKLSLNLFIVLCRTFATVSDVVKKDIRQYGLSLSEFEVIELLYHKGSQSIQHIGNKVLLTSGSMTYVIEQLLKKGLVFKETCEKDKRKTYVDISEKGKLLIGEIFPKHENCIADIFSPLREEQIVTMAENLKRISEKINSKEV